jgi:long-chain acyl-CoA synthetase
MLHHGAILHNCAGAVEALEELGLGDEVFLSFLPLSHAYEHTAGQFFPISIGAQIYYAEGLDRLAANLIEARPTIMTAVPRLYEALHQRITHGVRKAGGIKEWLFDQALENGIRRYRGNLGLGWRLIDPVLDRLVRDKVRARFGGRLKVLVSGGGPLNPQIGLFFTALGLCVVQGYGQTEAAPLICVNRPSKVKIDTVGPSVKNTEVRVADDGEILCRGELVMQGYWRNDKATRETIRDGWLYTGDIGEMDEDGYIRITDRKKDIIVNSGGDNLSPARIESLLTMRPEIAQAMVYGDGRPHLVALLVPDDDWARQWARTAKKDRDLATLADDADFRKALGKVVDDVNGRLAVIEKVRKFVIVIEPFSIENGQLTPTLKLRRHVIKQAYGKTLDALYN